MRTKTILVLITAIAACTTAILWRKFASSPVIFMDSELTESVAHVSAPDSGPASGRPVQTTRLRLVPALVSLPASEEVVAQLLAEIRQALTSTNLEARELILTNLLPALMLHDAPAAARLAEMIADGDLREAALRQVAKFWAAQDAPAALAWAAALADAAQRDSALTDVCLQIGQWDPAEAIRMREQFVPDDKPDPGLEGLAQQWAEKDFSAALAWILARARGEQRDQLIARIAFARSQTAPAEAARLLVAELPPGDAQTEAAISVLHQWALRDLAAATSWVERFPESPVRDRAVLELAGISSYQHQANAP